MAKQTNDDDDDGLPPIGEGTAEHLIDAKKGKPRNFLLICKGSKVKYLIVKKKPIKKGDIGEAKKLGYKGDACIGVITGSGMQLVFNLAISDGYESEPCSDKKLKDFLAEYAEFKCQPSFAIVATPPEVPFDDDDLNNPLVARFLGLANLVSQVLDKRPESQGELQSSTKEIRLLLQDADFSAAEQRINQYESRLKELLADEPAQETSPSSEPNDALKQKLQDALNKLVPQIKQAVTTYPERKVELLTPIAEIKQQIDAGVLLEARQGILAVGQLLKSVLQPDALRLEYEKKLAELMPQYEMALKQQLGDVGKFRALMAYSTEQAEAGVYAKAIKGIEGLAAAIEKAIQSGKKETDVIPENVVQTRKKFLLSRWQQAIQIANAEIAKIATPISDLVPSEDPGELVNGLTKALDSFVDEFNTAILSTQKASSKDIQPLEEAKQAISRFRQKLLNGELMQLFDQAKEDLGVDVQIRSNLVQAIDEIDNSLST